MAVVRIVLLLRLALIHGIDSAAVQAGIVTVQATLHGGWQTLLVVMMILLAPRVLLLLEILSMAVWLWLSCESIALEVIRVDGLLLRLVVRRRISVKGHELVSVR